MKSPHLFPALGALGVLLLSVLGLDFFARVNEDREIHALAPLQFPLKTQGGALQVAAFRQADLLPLYGSSELMPRYLDNSHEFFKTYPTGFNLYPVGTRDTSCLIMLQKFAAVGGDLRGKKVVVSLSPPWFYHRDETPQASYNYNFSILHAYELTFSTDLSFAFKQKAAERLLQYPARVENDPLLRFALDQLADETARGRFLYYLALPLGRVATNILRLEDHRATLSFITKHQRSITPVERRAEPIPWASDLTEAERVARQDAGNNPYGIDDEVWDYRLSALTAAQENAWTDQRFLQNLWRSKEWVDLELLLRGLRELGARPLILSMPIDGRYYEHLGMSAATRQAYHQRLRELAGAYQVMVVDFADHDGDSYFINDPRSHLSPEGWVYYNYVLDGFYHDTLDYHSPVSNLNHEHTKSDDGSR